MMVIGLTGGIGSGKSTVAKLIRYLGYPVYEADQASKRILFSNSEVKDGIVNRWGVKVLTQGDLDKGKLAAIVFNDKEELRFLEGVLHPRVQSDFKEWMEQQTSQLIFKEVAILFEKGGEKLVDKTVTVAVSEAERISRVMTRDQISEQEVKSRLNNQLTEEERNSKADFIIVNEGEQLVIPQVLTLIEKLKE